ncbi:hypothetical protein [Parafrankia sp. BMG5.11]|uniref:hypothetical protein n=1 Tax=Parafrankia sp. BMG5.11 TaxID=222540 RepID=UPI00140557D4|nr:hypothetical protein [Parafrankia sp. BMG5.11]
MGERRLVPRLARVEIEVVARVVPDLGPATDAALAVACGGAARSKSAICTNHRVRSTRTADRPGRNEPISLPRVAATSLRQVGPAIAR